MSGRRAEDASSEGSSHQEGSESSHSSHLDRKRNPGLKTNQHENFNQEPGHPIQSERSTALSAEAEDKNELTTSHATTHLGGLIRFRAKEDDDPTDWWFASTAIPLLAATFAPMANMLSIAALVVYWRNDVIDDTPSLKYATSVGVRDPQWSLNLNGASLACGFVGNIFLLCNFTRKIRYIIALPVTIVLFYVASAILIGITVGMEVYDPPKDNQVYSQGFWHAVIAACLYMLNAMLLMVNMLGYFLGHYPQHFDLNDEQRNLILQTMIFFVWLAGGAAVFAKLDGFGYNDALYFCDVTLLTIGFGDFVATTDVARGIVFPYTVGGTIILGLMVSSIHKFAQELSKEKVVKKHIETRRINTLSRAVSLQDLVLPQHLQTASSPLGMSISRPLEAEQIQRDLDEKAKLNKVLDRTISFDTPLRESFAHTTDTEPEPAQLRFQPDQRTRSILRTRTLERVTSLRHRIPVLVPSRKQKAILMRDEKDRFDKMRDIQHAARRFKKWYALVMSLISFGLLWCVGAVVFWQAEAETQGLTYFQALYFSYVSLLTIGYGDLSPKSNAGKPFFILWSLIAVPTMTILISDLGDTAIGGFKRKVLEYGGLAFLGKGRGWGLDWFTKRKEGFQRRLSRAGFNDESISKVERTLASTNVQTSAQLHGGADDVVDEIERRRPHKTIEELADEALTEPQMVQDLAYTLQRVADDMKHNPDKRYSYEEWVEFTRLIRFSRLDRRIQDSQDPSEQLEADEALDGLIEWDWLDENSPMTSEQSEAEWVMDRLLESLVRTFRKTAVLQALVQLSQEARPAPVDVRRSTSISVDAARRNSTGPMRSRMGSVATILSDGSGSAPETTIDVEQPQWSKRGQARLQHKRNKHHHHRAASGFHGHMSQHVKRNRIPPTRVPKKKKKDPASPVSPGGG